LRLEAALWQTVQNCLDQPAAEVQSAILAEVRRFVGEAPQFDDITLIVLKREELA
jgi:serine phosphatase RsbU (regulator of sigma subunit)